MFPYFTKYAALFYKVCHVLTVLESIKLLMYIVYDLYLEVYISYVYLYCITSLM